MKASVKSKDRFSRRRFLKSAVAFPLVLSAEKPRSGKIRGPNIVFIISDEHNAGVLGCYGNSTVATPNLDRLAARGVVFENCYCNSPLCVPSRLSFTAGKYASRVGAWSNNCWLPSADMITLPRILNAAGYESFLCGKMHYDRTRRYGFREIGGNMNQSFKTGIGRRRKPDNLKPLLGISNRFRDFHVGGSFVLRHDRKVTEGVVDFLSKRKAGENPFFLVAGYLAPHFPLIVPERYWQRYRGRIPLPVIPKGHLESQPLNYKHLRIAFNVEDVPLEIVRKGRELYYGLTQWVDNQIGKVLEALARSEAAENTVVIYTSDHGENMGEHGLWWKNCMYEHASRVPMIISYPRRWKEGQRRKGACSLVDVVQTIAEIAGTECPGDWNGDSLVRWLDDASYAWKDRALSEYYGHNIASGFVMLREGDFKYVYHTPPDKEHPAERELYNLKHDPGEFHNLASDPAQKERIERMHATLIKEVGEDPNETELRCRADYAKGYGRVRRRRRRKKA